MLSINIAKANKPMMVDESKFTEAVDTYVRRYGLTQMFNDAHSQITAKVEPDPVKRGELAWALAQKKLDALYAGETRVARVGGPRGDDVTNEVKRIAKATILGRAKSKGLSADVVKTNFNEWMAKYIAANEAALRAEAEANLAKVAELSVDLDDLMAIEPEGDDESASE